MSLNSDSDIADTYEEDITQSESANETSQLESDNNESYSEVNVSRNEMSDDFVILEQDDEPVEISESNKLEQ